MLRYIYKNESGFSALLIVVVISAVALIIAQAASLTGINELEIASLDSGSRAVFYLSQGCIENSIRRIQLDPDLNLTNSVLSLNGGECTINIDSTGEVKTITAVANKNDCYQTQQAVITVNDNEIIINNWQIIDL